MKCVASFFLVVLSTTAFAQEDLKKVLAVQQAEIQALKSSLKDAVNAVAKAQEAATAAQAAADRAQASANAAAAESQQSANAINRSLNNEIRPNISARPTLANSCVLSPTWDTCPAGFANHGNFYACFPNGSGLGADATGMSCGGTYNDRHITICCK